MTRRSPTGAERGAEKPRRAKADVGPAGDRHDLTPSKAGAASIPALVAVELKAHAPFTMIGTLTGVAIMVAFALVDVPRGISQSLFWGLRPLHVLLSAFATTAMFRLHGRRSPFAALVVGYLGSVGVATLSDCIIPYLAESLLNLPNRGLHLGFIEKWWLVNPLAAAGILAGYAWPHTRLPHAGHVLLSTWASLFHILMAVGGSVNWLSYIVVFIFLFVAVVIPCCVSDIVFPLLFVGKK